MNILTMYIKGLPNVSIFIDIDNFLKDVEKSRFWDVVTLKGTIFGPLVLLLAW
jgi:hypothetical protein